MNAPKDGWSVGAHASASLIAASTLGDWTICAYDQRKRVDEVSIRLAKREFIASQTCYEDGHPAPSVFGVATHEQSDLMGLRQAWRYDAATRTLIPLDPARTSCLWNEADDR